METLTNRKVTMGFLKQDSDTICALATAAGMGAISVVRVSGPEAISVVRKLAHFIPENPESHRIYYGFLQAVDEGDGRVLTRVLGTGRRQYVDRLGPLLVEV